MDRVHQTRRRTAQETIAGVPELVPEQMEQVRQEDTPLPRARRGGRGRGRGRGRAVGAGRGRGRGRTDTRADNANPPVQ